MRNGLPCSCIIDTLGDRKVSQYIWGTCCLWGSYINILITVFNNDIIYIIFLNLYVITVVSKGIWSTVVSKGIVVYFVSKGVIL